MDYKKTSDWEAVIGLEIHVQLNTKSKLFSADRNQFGDAPNTNISELSLALPGSLPVLNKEAVRKAVLFGHAISGKIQNISTFDRKSYFYPDCPRNYQITQYARPIILGGSVQAHVGSVEKEFAINRVHLEDDAGMLKHFSKFAGVDFNRAGVPLIEIVSEPCMHSAKDAVAYAMAIRSILDYLDISDCNMEEGSIRFDVNISVKKPSEKGLRGKIEIKNMNSFSNLEEAIDHEIDRQIAIYEASPDRPYAELIPQATYRWDPDLGKTVLMRAKENSEDYRYFPDPDLLPLVLTDQEITEIGANVPELPLAKEHRYKNVLGLSDLQSYFFTTDKKMASYFEKVLETAPYPKQVANWIAVEFTGRLKNTGKQVYNSGLSPESVGELVLMIVQQEITGKIAKIIADEMVQNPIKRASQILLENPHYRTQIDEGLLQKVVDQVIASNMPTVEEYLRGRERVFAFLVGQVMKETKGSMTPEAVNQALKEAIAKVVKK